MDIPVDSLRRIAPRWLAMIGAGTLSLTSALAAGPAPAASTPPAGEKVALATDKEKVSYAIGMDIGNTLKQAKVDLDMKSFMAAVSDVIAGSKPQMTPEQIETTMKAFMANMQARQAADQAGEREKMKKEGETNKKAGEAYLAENKTKPGVKVTPSGLQYKVIKAGTGIIPSKNAKVTVNYTGTKIDGTVFDTSIGKQPAEFAVANVIPGWTEALTMMPVGSKWQIAIPAELAYGEAGPGPIGPNSTLLFDVELLAAQDSAEPVNSTSTPKPAAH